MTASRLTINTADINDLLALKEIVVRRKARYENPRPATTPADVKRLYAEEAAQMGRLLDGMTIGLAPAAVVAPATPPTGDYTIPGTAADEGAYVVLNGETFCPMTHDARIVFVAESGENARLDWQEITEAPLRASVDIAELWAFAVAHGFTATPK